MDAKILRWQRREGGIKLRGEREGLREVADLRKLRSRELLLQEERAPVAATRKRDGMRQYSAHLISLTESSLSRGCNFRMFTSFTAYLKAGGSMLRVSKGETLKARACDDSRHAVTLPSTLINRTIGPLPQELDDLEVLHRPALYCSCCHDACKREPGGEFVTVMDAMSESAVARWCKLTEAGGGHCT
jgi:hypothetical protein